MQTTSSYTTKTHPLERFLIIAGTGICLITTTLIWWGIAAHQSMWPLPGLYFIEMAALSVFSTLAFLRGRPAGKFITWGAAGIFSAFSILGAFSVGFFYLPVACLFGAAAILSDVRNKQPGITHLGVCIFAGVVQVALMLAAIRML